MLNRSVIHEEELPSVEPGYRNRQICVAVSAWTKLLHVCCSSFECDSLSDLWDVRTVLTMKNEMSSSKSGNLKQTSIAPRLL
ncbi:hypothetical protein Y032_0110g165 [Ancylostoma ceylanicum]|uniref:Uncharacterized protein n=1 Tax=Ancylostoma ceylanicum TaxID=53326 RepID=A0A016TDV1_9BILA|nr:hypothetical protein Y032_0110g165 [Ancylostoma ceylanicum]